MYTMSKLEIFINDVRCVGVILYCIALFVGALLACMMFMVPIEQLANGMQVPKPLEVVLYIDIAVLVLSLFWAICDKERAEKYCLPMMAAIGYCWCLGYSGVDCWSWNLNICVIVAAIPLFVVLICYVGSIWVRDAYGY